MALSVVALAFCAYRGSKPADRPLWWFLSGLWFGTGGLAWFLVLTQI